MNGAGWGVVVVGGVVALLCVLWFEALRAWAARRWERTRLLRPEPAAYEGDVDTDEQAAGDVGEAIRYEGEVNEFGLPHGPGVMTLPHGQGVMTWADGRRYEGEWHEGKRLTIYGGRER